MITQMAASRLDLVELDLSELESALEARGHERFHARQLYRWIYKRGVPDFETVAEQGKGVLEALRAASRSVIKQLRSKGGVPSGQRKAAAAASRIVGRAARWRGSHIVTVVP